MNETTTTEATAIFAPLWKRKWLILLAGLLVAGGTYVYYKRKPNNYQATTQLYLNAGEESGAATKTKQGKHKKGKKAGSSSSSGANQVVIINSPLVREVANRRLRALHTPAAKAALRGTATAANKAASPFITISAEAHSGRGAALLANTVAETFIRREASDTQKSIKAQMNTTRTQLRAAEINPLSTSGKGKHRSSSAAATLQVVTLNNKLNQLESELKVENIKQVGKARASRAKLLGPTPKKNAIFGFVVGIFLASVAAYFLSRFDRRLRTLNAVEAIFGTQVLAALPRVKRPIERGHGRLVPAESLNEPLRRLHTALELVATVDPDRNGARHAEGAHPHRSILFLSPDPGDGKSTVVAGLALVQRDWGERVAVIEADFRRPVQASLLNVTVAQGLADVLDGTLALDEAMQWADAAPGRIGTSSLRAEEPVATMVESREVGTLSVLVGRTGVFNPPALLASRAMEGVLRALAEGYDYALIDAPSPLQVSDVMPLLAAVDGIVLLARIGHTREISARRMMQLLGHTPSAPVVGAVVNDVSRVEMERYGFYSSGDRGWLGRVIGRR